MFLGSKIAKFCTVMEEEIGWRDDFSFIDWPRRSKGTDGPFGLEDLNNDLHIHLATFVDPKSLHALAVTSKLFHAVARDVYIWMALCRQAWRLPASIANQDILKCVPAEHLPEVYDLITSGYDDITLRYKLRKFNGRNIFRITPDNTLCYVGDLLGSGNRAVRADVSFPYVNKDDSKGDCILSKMIRAFQCMKTVQKKAMCSVPKDLVKPFSYRWFEPDGSLHIEPRLVAYYEVTIMERESTRQRHNMGGNNCIAVGVASKEFPLEGLMPGWDCMSYAYHSDDGGIFHGTGIKVRYYGPQFGVGDVVGCGIDYVTKDVFFTLNGVHLGVAFTGVSGSLYPTVGIDSFCPIKFNFGEMPFKFSLVNYLNTKGYDKKAESFYLAA